MEEFQLNGNGYADGSPQLKCTSCSLTMNRYLLSVNKFRNDCRDLVNQNRPMPGTVLHPVHGTPVPFDSRENSRNDWGFPNCLVKHHIAWKIGKFFQPGHKIEGVSLSMDEVRKEIKEVLRDNKKVAKLNRTTSFRYLSGSTAHPMALVSIRRMMDR